MCCVHQDIYFEVLGRCVILCSKCSREENLITLYSAFYSINPSPWVSFLRVMHIRERSTACPFPTEPPLKKNWTPIGVESDFRLFEVKQVRIFWRWVGWKGKGLKIFPASFASCWSCRKLSVCVCVCVSNVCAHMCTQEVGYLIFHLCLRWGGMIP